MLHVIIAGRTTTGDTGIEKNRRKIVEAIVKVVRESTDKEFFDVQVFPPEVAGGSYHILLNEIKSPVHG